MRDKTTDTPGMGRRGRPRLPRGFTLVEMIVVIVLVGIVSGMVAMFIRLPVQGYVDSVARAEVVDTGDTVVRRIARDVRLALPNSIRVTQDAGTNWYLELLLTRTGGRYMADEDLPSGGHVLSFTDPTQLSFDIIGPKPTAEQAIQAGDSVVVYNLPNPPNAYTGENRVAINSVSTAGGVTTIAMASNPFAVQPVPQMKSPYRRFQVISGPVTYRWDATSSTLTRYWGYAISSTQPASLGALAAAKSALIANGVKCPVACFTYTTPLLNNSLLEMNFTLTGSTTNGGTVALFQQVHVDNTP